MRDESIIVHELRRASERGEDATLASVVRIEGSAYRAVGTRMVVRADGSAFGLVSGGCLEADLVARARQLAVGGAEIVRYDTRSDEDLVWGLGLGCDGMVDVLLERIPSRRANVLADFFAMVESLDDVAVLATRCEREGAGARILFDSASREIARFGDWNDAQTRAAREGVADAVNAGRRGTAREVEGAEICFETTSPPVHLVVCGSGPDAVPVAELAARQGWTVTVVDHRPVAHAHPEHFPLATVIECASPEQLCDAVHIGTRTVAVVMSHNYPRDVEYVGALLRSPARYVGVLGPRRRTERMIGELEQRGERYGEAELGRLYGPIGLDVGGDGPEAIALSIVAEATAIVSGRGGGSLRDRRAPIHDSSRLAGQPATA